MTLIASNAANPEDKLYQATLIAEVTKAIGQLKDREQLIIKRYFYDNKTLQEIGDELGISRQRTHLIYHQALDKLKKILQKRGYDYGS